MNEENIETKFNSGEHILSRINNLWMRVHMETLASHYYSWDVLLDKVWCELVTLMEEKEYEQYLEKITKINEEIAKEGSLADNTDNLRRGFRKITDEDNKRVGKQYKLLMLKEQRIRLIQSTVEKRVKPFNEELKKENWE